MSGEALSVSLGCEAEVTSAMGSGPSCIVMGPESMASYRGHSGCDSGDEGCEGEGIRRRGGLDIRPLEAGDPRSAVGSVGW